MISFQKKKFGLIRRYPIVGGRRLSNYWWSVVIFLGGCGFLLTGVSSYFNRNLLVVTPKLENAIHTCNEACVSNSKVVLQTLIYPSYLYPHNPHPTEGAYGISEARGSGVNLQTKGSNSDGHSDESKEQQVILPMKIESKKISSFAENLFTHSRNATISEFAGTGARSTQTTLVEDVAHSSSSGIALLPPDAQCSCPLRKPSGYAAERLLRKAKGCSQVHFSSLPTESSVGRDDAFSVGKKKQTTLEEVSFNGQASTGQTSFGMEAQERGIRSKRSRKNLRLFSTLAQNPKEKKDELQVINGVPNLAFFPQGLVLSFYGFLGLCFSFQLWLTLIWKIGTGFNEFNGKDKYVRIFRWGRPGKNRRIDIKYTKELIETLKIELVPKPTLVLHVKGEKEIPLTNAALIGEFIPLEDLETQATELTSLLQIPLEIAD